MKKRIIAGMICVLMLVSVLLPGMLAETLRYGAESSQVNQAQSRLAQLGYYKDKVDGKFGYSTYVAVKAFQAKAASRPTASSGRSPTLCSLARMPSATRAPSRASRCISASPMGPKARLSKPCGAAQPGLLHG